MLSEEIPDSLKTFFEYKQSGIRTPATFKMEIFVIIVTS